MWPTGVSVLGKETTEESLCWTLQWHLNCWWLTPFFKKKEDNLITFKSGSVKTQIDYLLTRRIVGGFAMTVR